MTGNNDTDILVSIILPIYNAGPYLSKCLDSLLSQTLDRVEIIGILDCPTDGSDTVLKSYASKHPKIRVIENPHNMHIGESRNAGLAVARGRYIGFCDHDDYCALEMCETMYNKMERDGLDLCLSNYVGVVGDSIRDVYTYDGLDISPEGFFESSVGCRTDSDFRFILNGVIWNKFFRRDVIEHNGIRFVDTKNMVPEDLTFLIEYSYYCRKIGVCQDNLYFHVKDSGRNTAATWAYCEPDRTIACLERTCSFLAGKGRLRVLQDRLDNSVRYRLLQTLHHCIRTISPRKLAAVVSACSKSPLVLGAFSRGRMVIGAKKKGKAAFMLFRLAVLAAGKLRGTVIKPNTAIETEERQK